MKQLLDLDTTHDKNTLTYKKNLKRQKLIELGKKWVSQQKDVTPEPNPLDVISRLKTVMMNKLKIPLRDD